MWQMQDNPELSVDSLGNNDLVQAGTDSVCTSTACPANDVMYNVWLEIPGSYKKYGATQCDGLSPNAGDYMRVSVADFDGEYYLTVYDNTQRRYCHDKLDSTNTTLHYGYYIVERPNYGSSVPDYARLGQFNDFSVRGYYHDGSDSQQYGISTAADTGNTVEIQMGNGAYTNIDAGNISNNSFTFDYRTSQGTQ